MAHSISVAHDVESARPKRRSADALAGGATQGLGWVPVALGVASIVAGLGSRNKGTMTLTLTAVASLAAVGAVRGSQFNHGKSHFRQQEGRMAGKSEVERSITIGKTADELRDYALDPRTLTRIMAGFGTVRSTGDGRTHWTVEGPLGRTYAWDAESVDRPDKGIGWRSLPEASISNEGSIRFHPAPSDRGTVATLHFRFAPPNGTVGDGLLKLLGTTPLDLVADRALRRFKSLVETGEIPTTERQPAARPDTR